MTALYGHWVGVLAYPLREQGILKQGALLFDQLITSAVDAKGEADLIERLLDAKVIALAVPHNDRTNVLSSWQSFQADVTNMARDLPEGMLDDLIADDVFGAMRDAVSREYARFFAERRPESTVLPLVTSEDLSAANSRRSSVLRVVLHAMPLPSEDTPWQAILDWRNDADATTRYRRLRAWVNGLCRGNYSAADARDELATLMDDYQIYMRKQHRDMTRSRMEVIATTAAEVLEDLAHVRFSRTIEALFRLLRGEATLLESELTAPGREVAYIVQTREHFT